MTADDYKEIRRQASQIIELIDGIEELKKELQDAGKQMNGIFARGSQDPDSPKILEKMGSGKKQETKPEVPGAMGKKQFRDVMTAMGSCGGGPKDESCLRQK